MTDSSLVAPEQSQHSVDTNITSFLQNIMTCGDMQESGEQVEVKYDGNTDHILQITREGSGIPPKSQVSKEHAHIHVYDMTDEEVERTWYTNADIHRFRKEKRAEHAEKRKEVRQLRKNRLQQTARQTKYYDQDDNSAISDASADDSVYSTASEETAPRSNKSVTFGKVELAAQDNKKPSENTSSKNYQFQQQKWDQHIEEKKDDDSEMAVINLSHEKSTAAGMKNNESSGLGDECKEERSSGAGDECKEEDAKVVPDVVTPDPIFEMCLDEEDPIFDDLEELPGKGESSRCVGQENDKDEVKTMPQKQRDGIVSESMTKPSHPTVPVAPAGSSATFSFPSFPAPYNEPSSSKNYYQTRMNQEFDYTGHRSEDLIGLKQEYQAIRAKLHLLIKNFKKYQGAITKMEEARAACFDGCTTLIQPTSSETFPDDEDKRPLAKLKELDQDLQCARTLEFQKSVLDYATEWEIYITTKVDAELKEVKKLQHTRIHYEKKVETLRKKVTGMEAKGKEVSEDLREKVERNDLKLQESWNAHETSASRLCALIEQVTQHGHEDVYPLLSNMMKWEFNRAGAELSLYGKFPLMLEDFQRRFESVKPGSA